MASGKNPEAFFEALHELIQEDVPFEVLVSAEVFVKAWADLLLGLCTPALSRPAVRITDLTSVHILPHIERRIHNSIRSRAGLTRAGALWSSRTLGLRGEV
jgi:hypothetical protein